MVNVLKAPQSQKVVFAPAKGALRCNARIYTSALSEACFGASFLVGSNIEV